jgi:hypothetical protein
MIPELFHLYILYPPPVVGYPDATFVAVIAAGYASE